MPKGSKNKEGKKMTEQQMEQLRKLKDLYEQGILTSEEYEAKKEKILAEAEQEFADRISADTPDLAGPDAGGRRMQEEEPEQRRLLRKARPAKSQEKKSGRPKKPTGTSGRPASKRKKPIYKRVWFWIVVVFAALLVIGAVSNGGSSDTGGTSKSQTESGTASDAKDSAGQTDASDDSKEDAEDKVTAIAARYTGDTEKGTVLDEDNTGIEVTATYQSGKTEEADDWFVTKPQTLKAGKTSVVEIVCGDVKCQLKVKCTSETKKSFKESCKKIPYKNLARTPDKYKGERIKIYGQVIQVLEDGGQLNLRVATKDSGYGEYYDDVVLVDYTYKKGESRILEDDMITVWGTYGGTYTYDSTMGGKITVPMMEAEYFSVK